MWRPESLRVENMMSHADTLYEFKNGVATMIYGKNCDDDAQESNGSGKSVLLEGVAVALVGTCLRDVRLSDLVMDGEASFTTTLEMYNAESEVGMKIVRKVPKKGSSKLDVFINGVDQTDNISSVKEGEKFIIKQLDISKDDLLNYFLISKEKYVSFFAFGDAKKKEVIGRFSNSEIINPVFENTKNQILEIERELEDLARSAAKVN